MAYQNHTNGASAEQIAAAYFIEQGYSVWMPCDAHSHIDFLISKKQGRYKRVQVKRAYYKYSGQSKYLAVGMKRASGKRYVPGDFDILVAVSPDWRLWRIPLHVVWKHHGVCLEAERIGTTTTIPKLRWDSKRWRIR